jgi:GNAT superfamily N-acetyltransferase
MQIKPMHPLENPQHLAALLPAFQGAAREYTPGFSVFGEARLRLSIADGYREPQAVLAAFADEQAVEAEGMAIVSHELDNNLDLAEVHFVVTRAGRALGADDALLDGCLRLTAELGRKRLAVGLPETTQPAVFAQRHGGRYTDTLIQSTLDLQAIDRAQYAAWAEPSAKNAQYTPVRWIDRCPDELAETLCGAMDAMADQPIGEYQYVFAKNHMDRLRFDEEQTTRVGARRYVQAAVGPKGDIAGFTALMVFPDEPGASQIWDTGVVRAHRGHGLGLRLKAAASLWLLEDQPDTRVVGTYNNNENQWMLAVNRTMGYRPLGDWHGYEYPIG